MGQIVKTKKKGRPSKADLASKKAADRDLRRSGRRRNVRYNFDFDDYLDDDEYYFVDEEVDENRREKKLELLLKLHGGGDKTTENDFPSSRRHRRRRESCSDASSSDGEIKFSKKRRVYGEDNGDADEDAENDEYDYNDEDDNVVNCVEVKKEKKQEAIKEVDSETGTPTETPSGFPLPDKKILVLILDKLQKKDIYGVYAEPVDPEELPDYHDIIERPIDFSTIRSQLANGSYATLEELESDILLLCSNAMQYNEPDTVYHKQARSIQEMAKKKFGKLRIGNRSSKKQPKLDPKPKSASLSDKQITRQISGTVQELVGSDFSSVASLATAGDFQNVSIAAQVNGIRRTSSSDGLVEVIPPKIDSSLDKVEESLSGKGSLTRFGRKLPLHDENRRTTYNISSQPETISESVFSTFDGESKQLIPVGLHVDHAYASSLARFAGSLGPVVWRVASQRIEQILPPGTKFGRGWVKDYEPLPTPVLMLENCNIKEPDFFAMPQHTTKARKGNIPKTSVVSKDNVAGPSSNEELQFSSLSGLKTTTTSSTNNPSKKEPVRGSNLEGKSSFYCAPVTNTSACSPHLQHEASASSSPHLQHQASASSPHLQRQTSRMRKLIEHDNKVSEKVELNGPPSVNHSSASVAVERQVSNVSEASTPRSVEMVSNNKNFLHSASFKQPNMRAIGGGFLSNNATQLNGKVAGNVDGGRGPSSCSDVGKVGTLFPHGQEPGLCVPVQQMRVQTENNKIHQKSANKITTSSSQIPSHAQSTSREDSGSAGMAAQAWMSMGAGGFRPVGENMGLPFQISAMTPNQQPHVTQFGGKFPVHLVQFQQQGNSPFHAFAPQAMHHNAPQFQNQPMGLPQFLTTDMSRIQMQFPWRGLMPHSQQPQKQETSPPDLNVSFHSPGSPGKPLSGVPVDSQQPDLALQL